MKNTKTLYWVFTGLFSALMVFTSIPDIMMVEDAVKFMNMLGYPNYFIPFIGVAKILGVIAILVPGYPRLTEWAFAGLAFDLIGAVYSQVASAGILPDQLFMILPFALLILSYRFYHIKLKTA
jgi:DoxX-like family